MKSKIKNTEEKIKNTEEIVSLAKKITTLTEKIKKLDSISTYSYTIIVKDSYKSTEILNSEFGDNNIMSLILENLKDYYIQEKLILLVSLKKENLKNS